MPKGIYKRKPKEPRKAECCPDKKHFARGLCCSCYWKAYWKVHPPRVRGERKKIGDRRYYRKNRRRIIKQAQQYYAKNRVSKLRYASAYQKAHLKEHNAASAKHSRNNPELYRAYGHKRRANKTKAGGSYTVSEWESLCKKYNYRCLNCGKKRKLTADHVIPISKGGTSNIDNIQPLCGPCNSSKGTKTTDFRRPHGKR